ncbi:MAG: Ig-like domain-containing protein [Eubacteriales bacterium]|nr:Ig-like domain-containing protein [Eubacteriales bacterium]
MAFSGKMRKIAILLLSVMMIVTLIPSMAFADGADTAVTISLDRKTLNLETGEKGTLKATIDPAPETTPEIEWSSSDKKVASVEDGVVTGKKQGLTEITAEYGGDEASCIVYVEKADAPEKLSIKVKSGNVNLGGASLQFFTVLDDQKSFQLEAVSEPAGASAKVKWSSSDKLAPIDEDGVVTVGNVKDAIYPTFTATSVHDDSVKATFKIYIIPPLTPSEDVTVKIDKTGVMKPFSKYIIFGPNQYRDYRLLNYKSDDTDVFDIASDGQLVSVEPKKPGTGKVTATDKFNEGNSASVNVTVTGFFIEDKDGNRNESALDKDKTLQLTAVGVDNDKVTWTSDDQSVATVDDKGLVTGTGLGATKIKAALDENGDGTAEFTAEYNVTVLDPANAYPAKIYTDATLYTDSAFKTSLKRESRYTEPKTIKEAYFFDVTDVTEKTYYVRSNTAAVNFGTVFDKDKVKVEILQDGKDTQTPESAKDSKVTLNSGDNKFTVKVSPVSGDKKTTEYKFNIIKGYDTNMVLTALSVKPADRDPASVEEGAFNRKFFVGLRNYTSTVYKDIKNVTLHATARSYATAHIGYSLDDGATWVDGGGTLNSEAIPLDSEGNLTIKVDCVSEQTYHDAKAAGENPYGKNAKLVYTITVNRIDVDPANVGIANITGVELGEGLSWCTPKWQEGFAQSAAVVAHTQDKSEITYHVKPGAELYVDSKDDEKNNLQTPVGKDSDGNNIYKVTTDTPLGEEGKTYAQTVVVSSPLTEGKTIEGTFKMNLNKVGIIHGKLEGMQDEIVDYLCIGSQYTNGGNQGWGTYGIFPEKVNMGAGNWYTCISCGHFGGYITFKYNDPITDDPSHKYGVDFTVFGNSNGGQSFSEPGNVLVSEDGKKWYTLAGSEHYDATTIWDYAVTYKKNPKSDIADYEDNLGNKESLGRGWAPYQFPDAKWYPLHEFKEGEDQAITVSGVRVLGPGAPENKGLENAGLAALPAFGYVDVQKNSSSVAGTGEKVDLLTVPVGDPYSEGYDGYGDGFDLKWAVDENGDPVDSSKLKIHYVKVQTASFINGGAIGEKSTEVSAVVKTPSDSEAHGKTDDPEITVAGKKVRLSADKDVYYMVVDDAADYDVEVKAADDANVYINNQRTDKRHYQGLPDKKMLRIITQTGEDEPSIKYIHLTTKGGDAAVEAKAAADDVEAMIDALPDDPEAKDYDDVVKAREAYEALSDESKKYVTNLDKLTKAEGSVKGAKVAREIDELSNKTDLTKEDIAAVRKDYDELTDEQKKDVTNYKELLMLERIDNLEEYVNKLKEKDAAEKAKAEKIAAAKKRTVKGLKLTGKKKGFKASWKKTKSVSGYRVCYSTKKNLKSGKHYVLVKDSKKSTVVKKLKKGKKYYVKVQTYNKISGKKYYGKWTKVKDVRAK